MWRSVCYLILTAGSLVLSCWWFGLDSRASLLRATVSGFVCGVICMLCRPAPPLFAFSACAAVWLLSGLVLRQKAVAEAIVLLLAAAIWPVLLLLANLEGRFHEIWKYIGYVLICTAAFFVALHQGIPKKRLNNAWLLHLLEDGERCALLFPAFGLGLASLTAAMCRRDGIWTIAGLIALLILWGLSAGDTKLLAQQRQLARREQALNDWQRDSREYMNTIRSQRHDFNLHIHALTGLIDSGDYAACRDYLHRMAAEAADVNDIMPVSDAVVGSMLYLMREEARSRGTDIRYKVTYDMRDTMCSGFACNKIIGNLLQNAIDAAVSEQDKACGIQMCVFRRRGNTVITVENRFTGERSAILRAFEVGYSTKKHHEGIGLSMVQRTLEQCGGRIYPEFEGERIRFVVNIPNRVNLDTEEEAM